MHTHGDGGGPAGAARRAIGPRGAAAAGGSASPSAAIRYRRALRLGSGATVTEASVLLSSSIRAAALARRYEL